MTIGTGGGRLLNLLAFFYAARGLGPSDFGIVTFALSTLDLVALVAGASMGSTATKYIAQYKNDKNVSLLHETLSLIVSFTFILTTVFTGFLLFSSNLLSQMMYGNDGFENLIRIGSLFLLVGVWRGVQDGILAGFERFRLIALNKALDGSFTLLLMVIFIDWFGLEGSMLALLIGNFLTFVLNIYSVSQNLRKFHCKIKFSLFSARWSHLIGFSLPTLLSNLSIFPVTWLCSAALVRSEGGAEALGIYNAGYQLHSPIVFVPMMISAVALPILSVQWQAESLEHFKATVGKLASFVFMISAMISLFIYLNVEQILQILGPVYRKGELVVLLVVFAAPFHAVSQTTTTIFQSINRAWYLPILHLLWGVLMLVITLYFIGDYGAVALAVALLVAYTALALAKLTCLYFLLQRKNQ